MPLFEQQLLSQIGNVSHDLISYTSVSVTYLFKWPFIIDKRPKTSMVKCVADIIPAVALAFSCLFWGCLYTKNISSCRDFYYSILTKRGARCCQVLWSNVLTFDLILDGEDFTMPWITLGELHGGKNSRIVHISLFIFLTYVCFLIGWVYGGMQCVDF